MMVSFTDDYNATLLTDPQKLKLEKIQDTLIILFYVSPSSPQLQRLYFFLKNTKTTSLQQVTGRNTPNLVKKRMLRYFLNIPQLKKIYNFKNEIRLQNLYKKENFKPEIKSMIENLQDELYQLENKQAKSAKLHANIRSRRAKNAPKLSSKYLKDRI